ncbi:hypothetical protein VKT23_020059 [Stygiomarasmius scandens]|uniref:Uncharacterized protein n=1 Tax=Marasmiellus scandens TaxID=2682957 RepID=A0ABR1IJU8_9AGAR
MNPSAIMDVDQDANLNPTPGQTDVPHFQSRDDGIPQNEMRVPAAQVQTTTSQVHSNEMGLDSSDAKRARIEEPNQVARTSQADPEVDSSGTAVQMRMEKRKRNDADESERGRARVIVSEMNQGLVNQFEAEISELKQAKANLENEIDDVNYQLKTEISDLKRTNKILRNEVINLRAVDVSLMDNIDRSSLTLRESEKLIPLITKLQNQIKRLEDPSRYVSADFEPSNETEKNLLTRINQLKILHNTALNQQSAFLVSLQNAQGEKEAFHQQTVALQETNTRVQNDLRKLQYRVEALQKSQDNGTYTPENAEKRLSPEFRSNGAQTDGDDLLLELRSLRENVSRVEKELEDAKEQSETFRKARDRVAIILKAKKEDHEAEKLKVSSLQQAAEQERVLRDEKSAMEAGGAKAATTPGNIITTGRTRRA